MYGGKQFEKKLSIDLYILEKKRTGRDTLARVPDYPQPTQNGE